MDFISLVGIALGLAMDALAVSITNGATVRKVTPKFSLKLALSFGLFQAVMPMLGWLVGKAGESFISTVDHWVAFILLSYLGIRMMVESAKEPEERNAGQKQNDISFKTLMTLSVATSIDALATGIILPSAVGARTGAAMALSVGIIGAVTFFLCLAGVYIGKNFGKLLTSKAELFGGVVLTGIGIKIFVEHMFFS
ncbi:manganese efflux pump MntP [Caproiciproducens faecalis]|uniref:Putative manganese efflux pump MntP n=1 Tax=Caproiciproducens faecalis TaxID=2820301 RepID=A0ABS7DS53_9FIRM|nr:manganese efflux pump MntP family protein [Caproiciproducens faecalis]MBW7573974.1 manganese efflux pump [Caproiciproducens faecalis]